MTMTISKIHILSLNTQNSLDGLQGQCAYTNVISTDRLKYVLASIDPKTMKMAYCKVINLTYIYFTPTISITNPNTI